MDAAGRPHLRLGLLRHAIAEDASPLTGYRDDARELTDDGRRRMRVAAQGMRALGMRFDVVLTSPLIRCVQTAEIVCSLIGGRPVPVSRLRPGLDAETLIDVILEHPDAGAILVCGHQPDMSLVTADLVAGGDIEFKKGALALVDLRAPRIRAGVLTAHYPPAALRRLGRDSA